MSIRDFVLRIYKESMFLILSPLSYPVKENGAQLSGHFIGKALFLKNDARQAAMLNASQEDLPEGPG